MRAIRFHPEARDEIATSIAYYDDARPGHGARFLAAVTRVIDLVSATPQGGTPWRHGPVRTWRMVGFPCVLAYVVEPDHVLVLAIAHTSRRPGYWLDRLGR